MRKILLGTTAVIGAALLAPTGAMAQGGSAPAVVNPATPDGANYGRVGGPALTPGDVTVRVGGYFAGWYSHTRQSNANGLNIANPVSNVTNGLLGTATTPTSTQTPVTATGSTKTGKNDFHTDSEIHVYVDGKAANGLRYGAVLELSFNGNEGTSTGSARRSFTLKTGALIDEAYAYATLPGLGQIRFGDEDGPFGGLMNAGFVTNFGTGGVYGAWQNSVVRPNKTTTSPGDLGDNTKIMYLSPQMFGFDFGVSYAVNSATGAGNGCSASFATYNCDRTYAYSGATANSIQPYSDMPQRRHEIQAIARYRTQLMGVGIAASFGHIGWQAQRDMTATGSSTVKTLRPGNVWQAGLQLSAYGFTLGAAYQWGQSNFFWGSQARGDQSMFQYNLGASYTVGPITVGANSFWGTYAGSNGYTFCEAIVNSSGNCSASSQTGQYLRNNNGSMNSQRRWAFAAGANYRLAPGMDIVAEYVRHAVHEAGNNIAAGTGSSQDKLRADVLLVGTRLAF